MDTINCEDEKIQFLGLIQNLGCLLVFNQQGIIKAISENIHLYFPTGQIALGKRISEINLSNCTGVELLQSAVENFEKTHSYKKVTQIVEISGLAYYLTLSTLDDLLYAEFEICINKDPGNVYINNNKLLTLQHEENAIWTALTTILSETLAIDRVMVYQFNEDNSGVVVAESLRNDKLDSYLGLHYPEFDIPQQARALYQTAHCTARR